MTDDDETSKDETPRRELRAKDLLARSESELAELEQQLDPSELAELSQWFAKPSRVVVEERQRALDEDPDLAKEFDQRQVRVAEASKAIEPRMIALLDRHRAAVDRYTRPIEPPPSVLDESILKVRPPDAESTIADSREYIRDDEIEHALSQAVPQAVLRDLYRDETQFDLRFTNPFFEDEVPEDPWLQLRAAVRERHAMPVPLATFAVGEAAQREFRVLIAGSWADKCAAVKAARGKV